MVALDNRAKVSEQKLRVLVHVAVREEVHSSANFM